MGKDKDIVYWYSIVFKVLGWISISGCFEHWIQVCKDKYAENNKFRKMALWLDTKFPRQYRIETWVFVNCILAFASIFLVYFFKGNIWFERILLVYSLLRVIEITVKQINVLIFDPYRAARDSRKYVIASARRMVILLAHNFFEIIFWFTVSYIIVDQSFSVEPNTHNSLSQALYISFVTMTTFGQPNFNIKDNLGMSLISVQSLVGLLMTLLTFARFTALLPNVRSSNLLENEPLGSDNDENA